MTLNTIFEKDLCVLLDCLENIPTGIHIDKFKTLCPNKNVAEIIIHWGISNGLILFRENNIMLTIKGIPFARRIKRVKKAWLN